MKRFYSLILSVLLLFSLSVSACAEEAAYTDVQNDAWYSEAVYALRENGLMKGVGSNRFDPEGVFTRAALATVLYRMAGTPAVTGEDSFTDTSSDAWYTDAVLWASQTGVVKGYGDGRFAPNAPTTQEQMAVMLWRDAGSYVLGSEYAANDGVENSASSWAVDAVRWARVDELLNEAVTFAPGKAASRGQVADMLYRYARLKERFAAPDAISGATQKQEHPSDGGKVLVAYFSCTKNTETIAGYIAQALDAELYQITPEVPYTDADRNYNDSGSRATKEQNDPTARPVIRGTVENMEEYDVIFLGYPIWWGQAPKIMYTFVESCDLAGKTIVPFCTSGSSPIGSSAANLSQSASEANWLAGARFGGGASRDSVVSWVNGLGLALPGNDERGNGMENEITLRINETPVSVTWEDNASVDALRELVKNNPLTIPMSMYGGFEQVGALGTSLPRSDSRMTTQAGDIVLYSGNQIVLFYGSNSWAYTRLGKVTDKSAAEMAELLGNGDTNITIAAGGK